MVPNATRVTIHLVVSLSGTAVTIISLPVLVKNELGNPHSSLYFIVYYHTESSSVNWLAVSCILTVTLGDTGFKCKSSTRFMCLIINHFVMYYSNPQVNYMVTVFIRLVIAVVYTLHLLSCSKCFVCLCLFQYRHCFLVGWCTNKSYVIATSDLWLFIHASNLLPLNSPSPLPYTNKKV